MMFLALLLVINLDHKFLVYDHKIYPIACGVLDSKGAHITPRGRFKVITKAKDPIYIGATGKKVADVYTKDKRNVYGTRIIVLNYTRNKRRISIHGTNEPDLMGQNVSHGCIRMLNADIEGIYDKVKVGDDILIR